MESRTVLARAWQEESHERVVGNNYGTTIVQGGTVHQGDRYYFGSEHQDQQKLDRMLDSLRFREMNLRENQIIDSHRDTFEWVFNDQYEDSSERAGRQPGGSFAEWLSNDQPQFWISGKPGSGKSTLMKFLADHQKTVELLRFQSYPHSVVVLKFYFWLHGTELQRTLKGCLCSLLNQLLETNADLVSLLVEGNPNLKRKRTIEDWSPVELRTHLLSALRNTTGSVVIFLDGLDELDKSSNIRDLLNYADNLSTIRNLKSCLSSRQEPVLEQKFAYVPKIRLQDLTFDDILGTAADKLTSELQEVDIFSITEAQVESLAEQIAKKSEGVFLWAVMVVKSLSLGLHNGDDIDTLNTRLSILPRDMKALYQQIWARLQEDTETYREESAMYFALKEHANNAMIFTPHFTSLVQFTIAANHGILQELMSLSTAPSQDLLRRISDECKLMKRKIPTRTAGLLEVVSLTRSSTRSEGLYIFSTSESPDGQSIGVDGAAEDRNHFCDCDLKLRQLPDFPSASTEQSLMLLAYNEVQYMHRSVAEFIASTAIWKIQPMQNSQQQEFLLERWLLADIATFALGYHSRKQLQQDLTENLHKVFDTLDERNALLLIPKLIHLGETLFTACRTHRCTYGWCHEVFFYMMGYTYEISESHYQRSAGSCFDFTGFIARYTYPSCLEAQLGITCSKLSPYYLGYLLICATTGPEFFPGRRVDSLWRDRLKRAKNITWLIGRNTDIQCPQICIFDNFPCGALLPRRPMVNCWLFVLRLFYEFEDSGAHLADIVNFSDALAQRILREEQNLAEEVVWSIGSGGMSCDVHTTGSPSFTIMLRMSLRDVQSYALSTIKYFDHRCLENKSILIFDTIAAVQSITSYPKMFDTELLPEIQTLDVSQINDTELIDTLHTALKSILQHNMTRSRYERLLDQKLVEYWKRNKKVYPYCETPDQFDTLCRCMPLAITHNIVDWGSLVLVAPDMFKDIKGNEWYEHGVLREWHEQRRRGRTPTDNSVRRYELINNLIPSYESHAAYEGIFDTDSCRVPESETDSERGDTIEGHDDDIDDVPEPIGLQYYSLECQCCTAASLEDVD